MQPQISQIAQILDTEFPDKKGPGVIPGATLFFESAPSV
jgi:hypothetical protein